MYNHLRKTRQKYVKTNAGDKAYACNFCDGIMPDQRVLQTEHCTLIRNRVPYEIWEHHKVLDHLLVVPKRHVTALGELTTAEQLDMLTVCAEFETKGYNIYARATDSPRRSAPHQHTHLIKIAPQVARVGLVVKKPYINIQL